MSGRDFLVYLAGPLSGLTWGDGQSWRDYVRDRLPREIRTISPLRAPSSSLLSYGVIEGSYEQEQRTSARGMTAQCRLDVGRADAVLVNLLGAGRVSIGTCIELGWADAARKPIFLVSDAEGLHKHPMLEELASCRYRHLDEAIADLEEVLMPEGHGTVRA